MLLEHMGRYEGELALRPVSGWAGEAVAYVKSRGLMQGDGQGFRGHSGVTRQELAQVLWNMRGFLGGEMLINYEQPGKRVAKTA